MFVGFIAMWIVVFRQAPMLRVEIGTAEGRPPASFGYLPLSNVEANSVHSARHQPGSCHPGTWGRRASHLYKQSFSISRDSRFAMEHVDISLVKHNNLTFKLGMHYDWYFTWGQSHLSCNYDIRYVSYYLIWCVHHKHESLVAKSIEVTTHQTLSLSLMTCRHGE